MPAAASLLSVAPPKWSRRDVLVGLGTLAATVGYRRGDAAAQASTGRIDIHHHMFTPGAVNAFRTNFDNGAPGPLRLEWTPEKSLEAMDRVGVRTAMLSCNIPFGNNPMAARDAVLRVSREMNDYGARLVADHPGRFGLFGVSPLPLIDESLREIEYIFDTLKADGVGLLTDYGTQYAGAGRRGVPARLRRNSTAGVRWSTRIRCPRPAVTICCWAPVRRSSSGTRTRVGPSGT